MSIYENYNLSINNDKLIYSYVPNTKNLFEISQNSNSSFVTLSSLEYNFLNSNYGFSFINNSISYRSTSNYFTGNVYIDGTLDAKSFSSKLVILGPDNKIPIAYLPPNISSGFVYNTNAVGIGTTLPQRALDIAIGDAYIKNGNLGIGVIPNYKFHLDKNDEYIGIPSFIVSSANRKVLSVYSERQTVIINDIENESILPIDTNVKLNINGLTRTNRLIISNILPLATENPFMVNKLSSNLFIVHNNGNIGIGLQIPNYKLDVNGLINCADIYLNGTSTNNRFTNIITQININSNTLNNNLITTSNIINNKIDNLLSVPIDIKGNIKVYNDTSNSILNIHMNNKNLYLITSNKLYTYDLTSKTFTTSNLNLQNVLIKTKGNNFSYYLNSNIIFNGIQILTSITLTDYTITENTSSLYTIDSSNLRIYEAGQYNNFSLLSSVTTPNNGNLIKIDSYQSSFVNNKIIVSTDLNELYVYTGTIFTAIQGITGTILDFSCGNGHTIVLTTTGVFSFGSDVNNSKFFKGYSSSGSITTNAQIISFFTGKKIIKVKAFDYSSMVLDNEGYVYIFGYINRLFTTTMIYKINNLWNITDLCCNNLDVYLLSYYNDIFTLNEIDNNNNKILSLPDEFYGTSIKSKGTIVIGGNNFYSNQNSYIPRNSLIVENYVGIGSNIIGDSKYSLIVSGNINIQNGSIYSNGQLLITTGNIGITSSTSPPTQIITNEYWNKTLNDIYYIQGNIGIGTRNPKSLLHINGSTIIESNLIVRGKLTTNNDSPFIVYKNKEVYYNGKFGVNNNQPKSTLDIYDGDFRITNIVETSGIVNLNVPIELTLLPNGLNTPYVNPIAIDANSKTIVTSFYNNDPNYNNNNIEIYKYYDNIWNKYRINTISENFSFGRSFAISSNGINIFIGAPKKTITSGLTTIITGGIYLFTFNTNTQLIQQQLYTYNNPYLASQYFKLGENINCSGDGNIIISTISDYNKLLYIHNRNTGEITILDFISYDKYHASFNQIISEIQFNPKYIYIDTNNNGSLIFINFEYDSLTSGVSIKDFGFFNLYIIRNNNEICLLKSPIGYENSFITSLSINAYGNRLFITTKLGYHFIYDTDFLNNIPQTTIIPNIDIQIKYFDILPSYIIQLKDDDSDYTTTIKCYRGKISKSGNNIYIGNYKRIVNFKLNNINNQWIQSEKITNINNLPNINNYYYDIDYYGLNLALSYIYKQEDSTIQDKISLSNILINVYKEHTSFYLNNSNLNIDANTYFTSNIYANKFYGDGSNISNILLTNLIINEGDNEIIYIKNKKFITSKKFIWQETSNYLYIDGNIITTSNIETLNGNIKSASNIYVSSNLYANSNIYVLSNTYLYSNLYINCNIHLTSNLYTNGSIYTNLAINANNTITSIYGDLKAGLNVIATSNIETLIGNIKSASNIIAFSNIESSNGNIKSGSNIIALSNIECITGNIKSGLNIISTSNIETLLGNIKSGSNIISSLNIETLIGNIKSASNIIADSNIIGQSNIIITSNIESLYGNLKIGLDIIGKSNLTITSNIETLYGSIITNSNIYCKYLYGDGSNISNIYIGNIIGSGEVINGGTGRSNLNINGLMIGNGENKIIVTSNIYWDDYNSKLVLSNTAGLIISNVAPIINVPFIKNTHYSEILNISNGGTGNNNFSNNSLLIYSSNNSNLITNSNLYWSNDSLYVIGNIYGDGSNIRNINSLNIISNVPVSKGGTGTSNFDLGSILIGNGDSNILTSSNITWDFDTNTLNISNINIYNRLLVGGSNSSNIDGTKIINIISLKNGGLGVSNIPTNEILFGLNTNKITSSSNFKWNEERKTLEITSNIIVSTIITSNINSSNINSLYISGDGYNLSNLDIAKISGILPLSKGGLGFTTINKYNLIYANDTNKLIGTDKLKWNDSLNRLEIIGDISLAESFSYHGNGYNITDINATYIRGIVPVNRGGTGIEAFDVNKFIIGNGVSSLKTSSKLYLDESLSSIKLGIGIVPTTTLDVSGITTTQNLVVKNPTSTAELVSVQGNITSYGITIGSVDSTILKSFQGKIGINISEPESTLHVAGTIKCEQLLIGNTIITSTGVTISSGATPGGGLGTDASLLVDGITKVKVGGTGKNILAYKQILVGNAQEAVYQTPNFIWDINANRLGIGIPSPNHSIDVNGDINITGTLRKNNNIIPSIASFDYSSETTDILYTNKKLYIGYSNLDNYSVKVNGNLYTSGYVTSLSDIRFKENITPIQNSIDKVEKLNGVYYNLLNEEKRSIGLIAQEVEKIIPEVVYTNKDDTKSISYGNMIGLLIESIKELNLRIKKLEEKL